MKYRSFFRVNDKNGIVMATDAGICSVILPGSHDEPDAETGSIGSSELTEKAAGLLSAYFRGEDVIFTALPVDLTGVAPFRKKILMAIRAIPAGEVKSYGEIAMMAGTPRAARAIGGAMACNPVPVIIPCHRIVAGDGKLTGFSAPGGIKIKKLLLEMEGIEFKGNIVRKKSRL